MRKTSANYAELFKVYRSKIADVDELKTHLIDERAQFHLQSIVDAAISQ